MTDRLERIFALQSALDGAIARRRGIGAAPREEWMRREALALMVELSEMITEVGYKWWKNPVPMDEDKVKEELIDILHFLVSMCIRMGMDAEEVLARYEEKNRANHLRQSGIGKPGYRADEAP